MILVDFCGKFSWFWLIFCYPDPFHWSGSTTLLKSNEFLTFFFLFIKFIYCSTRIAAYRPLLMLRRFLFTYFFLKEGRKVIWISSLMWWILVKCCPILQVCCYPVPIEEHRPGVRRGREGLLLRHYDYFLDLLLLKRGPESHFFPEWWNLEKFLANFSSLFWSGSAPRTRCWPAASPERPTSPPPLHWGRHRYGQQSRYQHHFMLLLFTNVPLVT